MGRAIVRQPKVFLFDEPLSNLDAKLRGQTRIEIQKLHAELGITSLFVTHDQVEAMTLAQRMIVMNGGVMEQFGTPEEVYHTPASTFVASFIGSPPMNLLKNAPGGTAGRILGIRPEHLVVVNEGGWEIKVDTVEMLGAERLVYGSLNGETMTVRIDEGAPFPSPARPCACVLPKSVACTGSTQKAASGSDPLKAGSPTFSKRAPEALFSIQAPFFDGLAMTENLKSWPYPCGWPTVAPASWRPKTPWPLSAWAPRTAIACSSAMPSCLPTACCS